MKVRSSRLRPGDAGFSMIEVLIVVAIIAIMAAVALPAIGRYIRVYQIQGATQQVAGELQAARLKAISRNVNSGVVFVIWSPTTYEWAMEDVPSANPPGTPPACPSPLTLGAPWIAPLPVNECDGLHGPVRSLPAGIEFDPAPSTGAPNACNMRFTRLGMWEGPGPVNPTVRVPTPACTGSQTFVFNDTSHALIGLVQASTGLHGSVDVSSGGRVQVIRHW